MTFSRRLAEQLARPSGTVGRLLGKAMDIANRRPLRLAVDMLAPRPGEAILDAGCGTGAAMRAILDRTEWRPECRVVGIDVSATMLSSASRQLGPRAEYILAPITAMPFAPGAFDAALALNVLYFEDDDGSMLRALHRVLRPGGRLVAYVTHRETMANWPFAREGLHRLYDGQSLAEAATRAGFATGRIRVHDVRVTRSVRGLLLHAER